MNEHRQCLDLAAASLDFALTSDEQYLLRTHLATCDACGRTAMGMRDDAVRLVGAPRPAAPPSVRHAVVGAAARRPRHVSGIRWGVAAAVLGVVVVGGAFVVGSAVDRFRGPHESAPTMPAAVDRSRAPARAAGWTDLGDISGPFLDRDLMSVMARPDGGLVALGLDRKTAQHVIWVSDDGVHWSETHQPDGVFGDGVPTSGALGGPGMLAVGWYTDIDSGRQRAIWGSTNGRVWALSPDPSALLGTNLDDLTMESGPAGTIVWAPSGRVWVSTNGTTWSSGSIGHGGITDVAVDATRFVAVGREGADAFLVTSSDGLRWGTPRTTSAAGGTQVGIERSPDDTEAIWIGDQRWERSGSTWTAVAGTAMPKVPAVESVMGGQPGLAAIGSPSSAGVYRAWTWDGSGDWIPARVDAEAGSGDPEVVAVAPHERGWFVVTRRGDKLHGWRVGP